MDEGAEEETDIAGPEPEASPPPPQTAPVSDDGPIVRLLNTITSDNAAAYGTLRQVLLVALGVGFLTAAGLLGATWHSRRTVGPGRSVGCGQLRPASLPSAGRYALCAVLCAACRSAS